MAKLHALVIMLALLVGSLLSMCCTPAVAPPYVPASSAQLHSVVTLAVQQVEWVAPALGDEDFGEHTGHYRAKWQGYCNAFAMGPELHLVTAAHCVTHVRGAVGSELSYFPADGVGVDNATVLTLDLGRDVATLEIYRQGGLTALERGPVPESGDPVTSVSAYFSAQSVGRFDSSYDEGYYRTTQWVGGGWSGSPVITNGRVWGVVSKYTTWRGQRTQGAIVSAL